MFLFRHDKKTIKKVFFLSLPIFFSYSLSSILAFTDSLILAKYDQYALAASLSVHLIITFLTILFSGMIRYTSNFISKSYGDKNEKDIKHYLYSAIFLSFVSYIVFFVIEEITFNKIINIFNHSARQMSFTFQYIKIMKYSPLLSFLVLTFSSYNNAINKAKLTTYLNLVSVVLNIILDLIVVNGIAIKNKVYIPPMGIKGAAYTTIISQFVSLVLFILFFLRTNNKIFNIDMHEIVSKAREVVKKGIFVGLEHFFYVLANTFNINFLQGTSPSSAVSISVVYSIDQLGYLPFNSLSSSSGILASRLLGERQELRIPSLLRSCLFISLLIGAFIISMYLSSSLFLSKIYLSDNNDNYLLRTTSDMIKILSIKVIFDSIGMVFWGILRGLGDTRFAFLGSIISNIFRLLLVLVLINSTIMNITWIWFFCCLSIGLLPIIGIIRYYSKSWLGNLIINKQT